MSLIMEHAKYEACKPLAIFDSEPWLQDLDRSSMNREAFPLPRADGFVLRVSGKEKKIEQIFARERLRSRAPKITATLF